MGKMKGDKEFEMLLDEIPHVTSPNLPHFLQQQQQQQQFNNNNHDVHGNGHGSVLIPRILGMCDDDDPSYHHPYMRVSPVSGFNLQSEGSSPNSFSGFEKTDSYNPRRNNTHYSNGLWFESKSPNSLMRKNSIDNLTDELGLSQNLGGIHIRDDQKDFPMIGRLGSNGFRFSDRSSAIPNHGNVAKNGHLDDNRKSYSHHGGVPYSSPVGLMGFDEERRSSLVGLKQKYQLGNLFGSNNISPGQLNPLFYRLGADPMSSPWQQTMEHSSNVNFSNLQPQDATFGGNCWSNGLQFPYTISSVTNKPSMGDPMLYSQHNWIESRGERGVVSSLGSPYLTQPKVPICNGWANSWSPQSLPPMRTVQDLEAFSCEDSVIIQGKDLNYVVNNRCDHSKEYKNGSRNVIGIAHPVGIHSADCESSPLLLPMKYNSLLEVQGYIYFIAKDQHGCRYLQRKFDEGNPEDVQLIFNEIIHHVVELMMNPFGNYLMQKLLDVCTEEQRMQILLMVTSEPDGLVKISLNTHGTRVVQKLIETVKTQQQISLVISALEPRFLDLTKDPNGNHVIQRCLIRLSNEDNKFIFSAAAKYCVDIATHRHGCCVLQKCITHSTGKHREILIAEISANGFHLAQDSFGNYVIQYILELKIPSATTTLISQFEGNYEHLSLQKCSSNVAEKCLRIFGEEARSRIIRELLSSSRFEQLLQDPFANYVIKAALEVSKGPLHASIVEAIRPHASVLRTSPYSKRIYSLVFSKK